MSRFLATGTLVDMTGMSGSDWVPLVLRDAVECRRLVQQGRRAAVERIRHPLPRPLTMGYHVDGESLVLRAGWKSASLIREATVSVAIDVQDRATGAQWRVVIIG